MRTDRELRSEFRSALAAVTPPAPWLADAVQKGLGTKLSTRRADRARLQLRFGLNVVAILVLIGLAVAAVGVYVSMHQAVVPAHPGAGPLIFPTKMVTASTGWAWVDPSELWRTTDGGADWTDVTPPSAALRTSPVEAHYFLDETHAWIAASHGSTNSAEHYITTFRTTDGGKTWQEGAPVDGPSTTSDLFPKLFFIDQNHGWLLLAAQSSAPKASTSSLYSTDDAGLHWNFTSSVPWAFQEISGPLPLIVFSSLTTGWILATGSSLLVTHDGGAAWHVQPLPVTTSAGSSLRVPQFFDPQHGLTLSWSSPTARAVLLATSDGGSTWVVRSLPGEVLFAAEFADANHGWAIGVLAADFDRMPPVPAIPLPLYKTDDGGVTWVPVPTEILWGGPEGPIDVLDFVDQNNGFAIRERYMGTGQSQLLKTTDGGRTWSIVEALPKPSRTAAS
jgi:photosystem II stability/assembly factor-like uncharacterized protein